MSEQTQQPTFLSRRHRRYMLKERGILKQISKLSFFSETRNSGKHVPRAIMIDLEPTVVDEIR